MTTRCRVRDQNDHLLEGIIEVSFKVLKHIKKYKKW